MADRGHIPNSPACGHWETLLADALDGLLRPEDEAFFTAHKAACPACTALFEEARKGREWLEFLSPEPQVPEGLLDRILAATGPGQVAGYGLVRGESDVLSMPAGATLSSMPASRPAAIPAWQRPGLMGRMRRFAEPRLLMTAAMAFFSIALTLNLTGVRLADLRVENLRPSAVRSFMERRLTLASTPIIRYYDHLRLVYEVESRMRELRRNPEGAGTGNQQPKDAQPGESKQNPGRKEGGSRVDPPQQSGSPASMDSADYLETYLTLQNRPSHSRGSLPQRQRLVVGDPGSVKATQERSTTWTA
jgi:hypothetical protein